MKLNYKHLLLSTVTTLLLTACGGGSGTNTEEPAAEQPKKEIPTLQTKQAKAQLGALSGATVEIHELGATPYKLLHTETTSSGDTVEKTGNFDSHQETLEADKFYLYTVSNGMDVDANDDGVIDAVPTVNKGSFHAIVQGKSVKKVKGDFKVTTASELLYKKVKADINDTDKLEEKLTASAKEIFKNSIDGDTEITSDDILQYNPVEHKEVFKEEYQEKLPQIIKDIHEDKEVVEKQAPSANAGGDKSIVIGESVTLKASGLDIDGSILSYSWSENRNSLSDKQSFTYKPTTLGTHTLTLTVTDNDDLTATDSVKITVVEKPNTVPTAKEASYTLEEDTSKSITLEGSDADNDALTYEVVVNPTYGTLSGQAPNLIYTPNANYNGSDRLIFVTNDGKADSKRTEIKLTITKVNDKPVIDPTETITLNEDNTKKFILSATDTEGDNFTYTITTEPTNGTLTHNGAEFTYTPTKNYNGDDSFGIKSNDGSSDSDEVTIMISVTEVNDAPTVSAGADASTTVGKAITLTATATDIEGEIKSYRWFEGDTELSTQATATYTPTTVGAHTLSVTVTDDKGLTATDRVLITVTAKPNTAPIATAQSITMDEDTSKVITLNGTDADQDNLTYKIKIQPTNGKITGATPNFTYTPNKDYFGTDSFTFVTNDGKDDSVEAIVSIMIADVEEPDVAKPVIILSGNATISITQNTTYTDAGATATDVKDGAVTVTTTGAVNTAVVGTYRVTYTATDKAGNIATKIRTIKVILPVAKTIKQYASIVLGFSTQYGTSSWSAAQVLGEPNTHTYGDNSSAWAPKPSNGTQEYISVGFPEAVFSTGVMIRETYGTGFVTKIELIDEKNVLHTVWSGKDDSPAGEVVDFTTSWAKTTYPVVGVKITIDTDHSTSWEEIDAIEMHGVTAGTIIDKTAPIITLNGKSSLDIVKGTTYTELGAKAVDIIDGAVTVTTTGTVNTALVGTYTITYTATDKAGNKAIKTRVVTVKISKPFITTWKTDNEGNSEDNQILIGTRGSGYNYTVDWGDGTVETNFTGDATHTYAQAGIYSVKISGDFPALVSLWKEPKKLLSVDQWGTNVWKSMEYAFYGCENLVLKATDIPDLSQVSDMASMFYGASVFNNNINDWNVSSVTDMSKMFAGTIFNQPLNTWDVSSVTNMRGMFRGTIFNQSLNDWDVSSVTDMREMFSGALKFDQPLNNWDVSNVTNMKGMFSGIQYGEHSIFNQDISMWDVSNVTDMAEMFNSNGVFNQPIGTWDVSSVMDMHSMFFSADKFNQPLNDWDVSSVTNISSMFSGTIFNQDISSWNVENVTHGLSYNSFSSAFNQDFIRGWFDDRIIGILDDISRSTEYLEGELSVNENQLFFIAGDVKILNISDKSSPHLLANISIDNEGEIEDFALSQDRTILFIVDVADTGSYVANGRRGYSATKGLRIIDISDINNPVQKSFLHFNDAISIVLSKDESKVYIVDNHHLRTIDISDVNNPNEIHTIDTNNLQEHIRISSDGTKVYVTEKSYTYRANDTVKIYDISGASMPSYVAVTDAYGERSLNQISPDGNRMYFISTGLYYGSLNIVSLADGNILKTTIESETSALVGVAESLNKQLLYVSFRGHHNSSTGGENDVIRVYNIKDIANPILIETMKVGFSGVLKLSDDEKRLYINHTKGVTIVDVSGE